MSRQILCEKCGVLKPMHHEDVMMGWKRRRIIIDRVKKPKDLAVTTYSGESLDKMELTSVEQLRSLMCDGCGDKIPDDQKVVAVTMWRDIEPEPWEHEYGAP